MADQNILVHVGADISNLTSGLRNASQSVSKFAADTQKTFRDLGKIGAGLTTLGVGIAAGLGVAVKKAADFDTAMRKAGAIAGANAQELQAMKDAALDLGANTSKSATEVANGMTELAAKGFTANETIAAMPGIIKAAEASGEDLALVSDTVTSALNAFGMAAGDANKVADIMAMTSNKSAAGVEDLQYAFKYAAAPAAALGISIEELAAATGEMVDAGLDGSQAGTTLRASLLRLVKPPKQAREALEKLGVSATDQDGKFKSLQTIVGDLQKGMKGMTDSQKAAALAAIFGTESVSGMMTLVSKGPEELGKFTKALENSGGMAEKTAAKMKAGIGGSIEQLTGALESLAIGIGDQLLPYIKMAADFVTGLVNKFNGLSDGTKKFIAFGAAITATLLLIVGPMLVLIGFIPAIVAGFTALGTALAWIGGAFAALASPVTLVIAVIVGIIAAIVWAYNQFSWFRDGVNSIWTQVVAYFNQALTFIKGIVQTVMSEVSSFFGAKLAEIMAFWNQYGGEIMGYVKLTFTYIVEQIKVYMAAIKAVFQVVFPIIAGIVKIAWEGIKTIINNALAIIKGIIKVALAILSGDWKGAWTAIKQTAVDIMNNMIAFFKGINLAQIGKNILQGLINGISSMAGAVKSAISNIANMIPAKLKSALGIHSPSRVMMELGVYTGKGFQLGLEDQIAKIKNASMDLAGAALPSLGYQTPSVAGRSFASAAASNSGQGGGQPINVTLNYSGSGSQADANHMLDIIERGLADRLRAQNRMNGLKVI